MDRGWIWRGGKRVKLKTHWRDLSHADSPFFIGCIDVPTVLVTVILGGPRAFLRRQRLYFHGGAVMDCPLLRRHQFRRQ